MYAACECASSCCYWATVHCACLKNWRLQTCVVGDLLVVAKLISILEDLVQYFTQNNNHLADWLEEICQQQITELASNGSANCVVASCN